jgi:pyruvate-formate lyase-activating enzyme
MTWKQRWTDAGLHLFDRATGINVLLDELRCDAALISAAPRYVSIAVTNACDLRCSYCYAPKSPHMLPIDEVARWASDLDAAGCLGIGFGGGEPTLHPSFSELCSEIATQTALAVTFTTHGHRLTSDLIAQLDGNVHFSRLSIDGVGATYERLRGRPFPRVQEAAHMLRSVAPLGINTVVNVDTIDELDAIGDFAELVGAAELLLLPQQRTSAVHGIGPAETERLLRWIDTSRTPTRLAVSRSGLHLLSPNDELIPGEDPTHAHLHVDATGSLRRNAYAPDGVSIEGSIIDAIMTLRERI